jgi:CHAT domain-containing protein
MKRIIFLILLASVVYGSYSQLQKENIDKIYDNFSVYYTSGDLLNAQKCLLEIVQAKDSISKEYLIAVFNNLGVTSTLLGQYQKSLDYCRQAEELIDKNNQTSLELADIYINKARNYNLQKIFSFSIEYLEKSLRIYQQVENPDIKVYNRISAAYQNLGISYGGIKNYKAALNYFEKSADIKMRFHLSNLSLSYLNIANTLVQLNKPTEAEKFFIKSINELKNESALGFQRIADIYFDYGIFLRTQGRETEAFEYHEKALAISLKNYGVKHPYVSLAYKYIGDHYSIINESSTALGYYQKAIISLVKGFDNLDISFNPPLDSALLDLDLLKILQKKSEVLEKFSFQLDNMELKNKTMTNSLETIEVALQLINKIRTEYLSEESRLYLMDNEKETYLFATHINRNLYTLTGKPIYLENMYRIARQAKSAILHNEITDNEVLYSIGIPEPMIEKHNQIKEDIASYNNLIHEEVKNSEPDNKKLNFWKDQIFELNREKERIKEEINNQFPQYKNLLQRTEPISLEEIQNHLKAKETLIEYLLSNKYIDGKRKLYTFIITKDSLYYHESFVDSVFTEFVESITYYSQKAHYTGDQLGNYKKYTIALFNMYTFLIGPVENLFTGTKLIIIPDEEISYLPFDAFIRNKPDLNQINYEGTQYLIKQYSISYGYSSSLIFNNQKNKKYEDEVYAFSPDYVNTSDNSKNGILKGTKKEIHEIFRYFKGKEYSGDKATECNFRSVIQYPAILHLAMHTSSDTTNSRFSSLVFDTQLDTIEDGYLHDFEISLCRINSQMVVLSSCNTGTGILYHGEGVMSITRSFILAGASSVIKTLWEVNDDASAKIVSSFYTHLSKGKDKDDALRLAKLEYMKNSSPGYSNPYYWASYQVMGDVTPITHNNKTKIFLSLMLTLAIGGGIVIYYFKRRRSFLA